jgi:hypothetical protein
MRFLAPSVVAAISLLVGSAASAGDPAPLCTSGVFAVVGSALVPDASFELPDLVTLEGETLTIASGASAEVSARETRRGTLLRGRLAAPYVGRRPFSGPQFKSELAVGSWNVLQGIVDFDRPGGGSERPLRPPRVKALVDPDCKVMTGRLRARGLRRDFVATAVYDEPVCGTIVGIPCAAGSFCELPADTCQSADLAGVCVPQDAACTQQWDPVCGCDGASYGNDCMRVLAGAQKAHDGACEVSDAG